MTNEPNALESRDTERHVLSAVYLNPDAMPHLVPLLMPDDMSDPAHKAQWEAAVQLFEQRIRPTRLSIKMQLEKNNLLAAAGGEAYLLEVENDLRRMAKNDHVSTVDAPAWARQVAELSERRQLVRLADDVRNAAQSISKPVDLVRKEVIEAVTAGRHGQVDAKAFRPASAGVPKLREMVTAWAKGFSPHAVSTGYDSLNKELGGGLTRGQVTMLVGRPGTLKTCLTQNIFHNVSSSGGQVALNSLEMQTHDLLLRDACRLAGVDVKRLTRGDYNEQTSEYAAIQKALSALESRKGYHVMDYTLVSSADIYYQTLILKAMAGRIDLHGVDYAQLSQEAQGDNERLGTAMVFRNEKALCHMLNCASLIVSTLNRQVDASASKLPQLHHLMQAGEYEGDVVLAAYYPREYYNRNDSTLELPAEVEVDADGAPRADRFYIPIIKGRYVGVGMVCLGVNPASGRMWDLTQKFGVGHVDMSQGGPDVI